MVMKNGDIQFKSVMTGNLVYEVAFASIYFECISTMFTVNICTTVVIITDFQVFLEVTLVHNSTPIEVIEVTVEKPTRLHLLYRCVYMYTYIWIHTYAESY